MKQQKFFVGDVVKRTNDFGTVFGSVIDVIYKVDCVSDDGLLLNVTDGYYVSIDRYAKNYTIVERAWQENTGNYSANNLPVDEGTTVWVKRIDGSVESAEVQMFSWTKDIDDIYIVQWRVADEYENPEAFFEQEQPVESQPPVGVALGEELVAVDTQKKNKYTREIKPNVFVDVYDVLRAFNVTDPCLSHLAKKALAAGQRHHKDRLTDLQDIKASIERAIEMHKEWN